MVTHLAKWMALVAAGLLAACGGGGEPDSAPLSTTRSAALAAAPPNLTLPTSALFNWAETAYPKFFPTRAETKISGPYEYRYYPESGNYVGVAGDDVFVLGPISAQKLLRVGSREEFRCRVLPQECVEIYPRAGYTARLSSLAHGVAGNVAIIDARTIRITGFRYDGTGPLV